MSPALQRVLGKLEECGCEPKWDGQRGVSRCPAHDDGRPSLSIGEGDDGKLLLYCHAGCTYEQIVRALEPGSPAKQKIKVRRKPAPLSGRRIFRVHGYEDEQGNLLYETVRYDPKDFRQRRPDGHGGWIWNLQGVRLVAYGLPELLAAKKREATLYVTEGEKDAEAINALPGAGIEFFATCFPLGAGKWRDEYAGYFRGAKRVLVIADKDRPGRRHARQVAEGLQEVVGSVEIVEARKGKDAADHLAAGHGLEDFVFVERLQVEDLADILNRAAPETPWAVVGLLTEGDVGAISGAAGEGKTWIAYALALSLATGQTVFGRYATKRAYRVAIFDLESRSWEVDQRLHRIAAGMGIKPGTTRGCVYVVRQRVRLDSDEEFRRVMTSLRAWGVEFLLVDSFRRAIGGDENKSEVVSDLFTKRLDRIRIELGCGVIFIDHTRKRSGDSDLDSADQAWRGSSDKRGFVDWHVGVERRGDTIAWMPTKQRHGPRTDGLSLKIDGLEPAAPDMGPVRVTCLGALDQTLDRVQDAVLVVLGEAGAAGMLRKDLLFAVPGRTGYSMRSVEEGLSKLVRRRRIIARREGKQTRFCLGEDGPPQPPQTSAIPGGAPGTTTASPKETEVVRKATSATSADLRRVNRRGPREPRPVAARGTRTRTPSTDSADEGARS